VALTNTERVRRWVVRHRDTYRIYNRLNMQRRRAVARLYEALRGRHPCFNNLLGRNKDHKKVKRSAARLVAADLKKDAGH